MQSITWNVDVLPLSTEHSWSLEKNSNWNCGNYASNQKGLLFQNDSFMTNHVA